MHIIDFLFLLSIYKEDQEISSCSCSGLSPPGRGFVLVRCYHTETWLFFCTSMFSVCFYLLGFIQLGSTKMNNVLDWCWLVWPGTATWPLDKDGSGRTEVLKISKLWNWFEISSILADLFHIWDSVAVIQCLVFIVLCIEKGIQCSSPPWFAAPGPGGRAGSGPSSTPPPKPPPQTLPWHTPVVEGSLCSVQCAVYSVQCAVCSVQCAVCSVQCAVCSLQCEVFSLRSDLGIKQRGPL